MAKKVLTFLIKSDIKQTAKDTEILLAKLENTNKETKDLTNNFGAFGITIGSIKKKFSDVAKIVNNGLKTFGLNAQIAGKAFQLIFGGEVKLGAKLLFDVIKKGIAATGIGLFAIALGSVVTFLAKTKKGAELLERTLAGLGAAFKVIRDRVSGLGEGILKLFSGDTKAGFEQIKGSFKGIGDEIVADTKAVVELKKSFQDLRDSNRELRVETAKSKAKIEELRLIAADTSKSTEERQAAAQKAFDIENKLLNKRIENAKEAIRIQIEENKTAENKDEALDALADKEIALADLQRESATRQRRIVEQINQIQRQGDAEADKARKKKQDDIDKANKKAEDDAKKLADKQKQDAATLLEIQQENSLARIDDLRKRALKELEIEKNKELQLAELMENSEEMKAEIREKYRRLEQETNDQFDEEQDDKDKEKADKEKEDIRTLNEFKMEMTRQAFAVGQTLLDTEVEELESSYQKERQLAEKNGGDLQAIDDKFEKKRKQLAKKQKAFKVAQALVNTFMSATGAYQQAMDGIPAPAGLIAAPIAAGMAVAAGLANVRQILKQDTGGGGGGGGAGGGGSMGGGQPAPEMQSGKFELSAPAQEQEPVRAFVVTDDVTQGQDKLSTIRRNAVI